MRQIRLKGWVVWCPLLRSWMWVSVHLWEPTGKTKRIPVYAYDHEGD